MKLNPIWLKTFRTLVDTGHFTRTAERLFMTQPGVSQHIQKLEAACEYALISRNGRSFSVTAQGETLYRYACELETAEQQLLARLGEDDPHRGLCRIGCSGASAVRLYRPLLAWQQQHPGLVIHMQAAPYRSIVQQIGDGTIDLGIVTEPPDPQHFTAQPIGCEAIAIIVPAAKPQGAQPLADYLQQLGMIRHPDSDYYITHYLQRSESAILREVPFQRIPTRSFINQIHDILLPVAMGLGFAVLPRSVMDTCSYRDELSVMGNMPLIDEPLYLIHRKDRQLAARFEALNPVLAHHLA